jgi:hypothetical protein
LEGDHEVTLQYADPSSDGSDAALKILKNSLNYRVRKHTSDNDVVEARLSETIRQIWQSMNRVRTGLESATLEFKRVGEIPPKILRGVEFTDILEMSDCMGIKQVVVNEPWSHLTFNPTSPLPVLFCKSLGQPIIPVLPHRICNSWRKVPSGQNYLVLPGRATQNFLRRNEDPEDGSCLAEKIKWIHDGSLVQSHRIGHPAIVFHTQRLRSISKTILNKTICQKLEPYTDACFIFSNHHPRTGCSKSLSEQPKQELHRENNNVPNASGPTAENHCPDVPESSSQTSASTTTSSDPNGSTSGSSASPRSEDSNVEDERACPEPDLSDRASLELTLPFSPSKYSKLWHRHGNVRFLGADADRQIPRSSKWSDEISKFFKPKGIKGKEKVPLSDL